MSTAPAHDAAPLSAEDAAAASAAAKLAAERKRGSRLQELDALRALMVLVVLFHAYQASTGDMSVHALRDMTVSGVLLGNVDILLSVFFLLSGFALYFQFAPRVLSGKPLPPSGSWLYQRALRLLPVYYVVFMVVWFWRYGGGQMQWMDLVWGLSLMQTWSTDHIFRTIDPGWYLSVEWHFAVVSAVAILPWLKTVQRWPARSRLAGTLVPPLALIVLTVWWRISLRDSGVEMDEWGAWFAPPSWGLMYGAGMLLAMALIIRPPHKWLLPRPASVFIFAAATSWLVYIQTQRGITEWWSLWYFDLGVAGTMGWMIAALTAPVDGRVRRFLRDRRIQTLAGASFATYVIHAPILRSLAARDILPFDSPQLWPYSAAAIVVVSLTLGVLAHRYIELPLSSVGKLREPKFVRATRIARVLEPTIAVGDRLPAIELADDQGTLHRLDRIAGGQPFLLLIHPTGIMAEHPWLRGGIGALRALDAIRPAAASQDLALATLAPTPVRRGVESEQGRLAPMPRLIDPACGVARKIGVGVLRTAEGRHLPEVALLVIGRDGAVQAIVRDENAQRLVQRGLIEAGSIPGLSRTGPRDRRGDRPPADRRGRRQTDRDDVAAAAAAADAKAAG